MLTINNYENTDGFLTGKEARIAKLHCTSVGLTIKEKPIKPSETWQKNYLNPRTIQMARKRSCRKLWLSWRNNRTCKPIWTRLPTICRLCFILSPPYDSVSVGADDNVEQVGMEPSAA